VVTGITQDRSHEVRRPAGLAKLRPGQSSHKGQALTEFALIIPIMFLIVIAVADFGRLFSAAVATESAAREAADYGAFLGSDRWAAADSPWTVNADEMKRRSCMAAAQLQGFANISGNCDENPTMTWELLSRNNTSSPYHVVNPASASDECAGRIGLTDPCVVHVTVTFTFRPFLPIPPIPSALDITRESWFAVSDLTGT
jgi:Flp pilus assembly protein TadG